jgi:hypothetical protein
MKLTKIETATIYTFSDKETEYRIECIGGIVTGIARATVEYYDDGDAENGPSLGSDLSDFTELETGNVWFESHLDTLLDSILKDAEAYTLHLMMCAAHEDGAPRPSA